MRKFEAVCIQEILKLWNFPPRIASQALQEAVLAHQTLQYLHWLWLDGHVKPLRVPILSQDWIGDCNSTKLYKYTIRRL